MVDYRYIPPRMLRMKFLNFLFFLFFFRDCKFPGFDNFYLFRLFDLYGFLRRFSRLFTGLPGRRPRLLRRRFAVYFFLPGRNEFYFLAYIFVIVYIVYKLIFSLYIIVRENSFNWV